MRITLRGRTVDDYTTQKATLLGSVIVGVFTSNLTTTLSSTTATRVFLDVAIDEVAALKNKYRYRLEALVKDKTEVTKFIIFDDEAEKLIGQSAISLYDMEDKLEDEDSQGQLPGLIGNLIGQTFVFHVRLTEYNRTAYTQSFGASKANVATALVLALLFLRRSRFFNNYNVRTIGLARSTSSAKATRKSSQTLEVLKTLYANPDDSQTTESWSRGSVFNCYIDDTPSDQ
ncbi:unnamed protein product [Cuscuta campestris]|uniref:Replication factor A C-terminal domain-containing protein n=1 Tax=Cuscuta campestris TaxID=132261 RepID=A0A484L750_9ASTE|nr:unnamed protein product [Cuscuta campestris]